MHQLWTIPTAIMMYTRSHNYTNLVVGEYGMQAIKVVVVLLLFDVLSPKLHIPYYILE